MTQEQIISIIRQIMLFFGGIVVARGWVDNETMLTIAGAISAIVASGWAIYTRRKTGIIASAAALPDVTKIETAKVSTAMAVPSTKVQPSSGMVGL